MSTDIDKRIAEEIMGWKLTSRDELDEWMGTSSELCWFSVEGEYENGAPCHKWECTRYCLPKWSKDISAAFEVVEKMREKGWFVEVEAVEEPKGGYEVIFVKPSYEFGSCPIATSKGTSLPMAICLAALRAVN